MFKACKIRNEEESNLQACIRFNIFKRRAYPSEFIPQAPIPAILILFISNPPKSKHNTAINVPIKVKMKEMISRETPKKSVKTNAILSILILS